MWKTVLFEPVSNMLNLIGTLLFSVLKVVLILVLGWLIAKLIQRLVTNLLKAVKFDLLADQIKANSFIAKGGIKCTLSELLGAMCYWLALLVVVVVAVNAVGLTVAADMINRIVLYIPNVIVAILVLVLGIFVATFLSAAVQTAAVNAGIEQAKLLSKVVETAIVVLVAIIALEQLNIGTAVINTVITVLLASLGLGFAIAVGLGCKDLVGRTVSEAVDKLKRK